MIVEAPPPRRNIAPAVAVAPLQSWLPALFAIAAVCAVFGVAFQREIVGAVRVWATSLAYNYCFLVVPLVVVLLWGRRGILAASRPAAAPWALLAVAAVSAFWTAAALLDILELEQFAVVALFEVLLLAILGWRVFRSLLAPLLLLFFLVPYGEFLLGPLQRLTAAFAARGIELLGIPVFTDGLVIQIPEGSFEVAEACAGLRFLITSIVFGCFFATVVYRSKWRRLAFVGLSIVVPIVANGLRVVGLIALAHLLGSAAAVEADHILYGWIFFSIVILLLIAVGLAFEDRAHRSDVTGAAMPPAPAAAASSSGRSIALTALAGLALALVGSTYLIVIDHTAAAVPGASALPQPTPGSGWVRESDAAAVDWSPLIVGADRQSLRTYRKGNVAVTEFAALYRLPRRGSPLTWTINSIADSKIWATVGTGRATATLGGQTVTVNTAVLVGHERTRVVWWLYDVDDRATASLLRAKLLQARAALSAGPHVGTLLALSAEVDETVAARPILTAFLKALHPAAGASPGHAAAARESPGVVDRH